MGQREGKEDVMLIQIIYQFQEFRRTHGKLPNVLYLNAEHHAALRDTYPELMSGREADELVPLGLKIVVVPSGLLRIPRVACVLPGVSEIFHCEGRFGRAGRHKGQVVPTPGQGHDRGTGFALRVGHH